MTSSRIAAAILAGTSVLVASPAFAINTGNIAVSLTIEEECTMATNPLAFGTTGIIDEDMTTTALITIECTSESPYAIALSDGENGAGDVADRKLKSAADDFVDYQLYTDIGHNTVWGETIGDDTVDSASAAGVEEEFTVYALVPSHQNVPAGSYTDNVTATIWYGDDLTP